MTAIAQHRSESAEWYTPTDIVESARTVLGRIDLDPASSAEANAVIKARTFWSAEQNALGRRGWGRVFLNPPGRCGRKRCKPCRCLLPRRFWRWLIDGHCRAEDISAFIWIGYSIEQLQQFQGEKPSPFAFQLCFPARRLRFRRPGGEPAPRPTHANYVCYSGPRPDVFKREFCRHGEVR